jgi:hypothetical protein
MVVRKSMCDSMRLDYRVYLEPVLARACEAGAEKVGCRTISKYIRYSVINQAVRDGYPLGTVSKKFDKFINKIKNMDKGVSTFA